MHFEFVMAYVNTQPRILHSTSTVFLEKFLAKGGLKSVKDRDLGRGSISQSKYREEILLAELKRSIFITLPKRGSSDEKVQISHEAQESVVFYAKQQFYRSP